MALVSTVLLSGCVNHPYAWNGYGDHLYDLYNHEETDDKYLQALLGAEQQSLQTHRKMAPGLYAEIGTAYLRAGDSAKATSYYQKEADTWPDAKPFMTSLIEGVKRYHPVSSDAGAREAKTGEKGEEK